MMSAPRSGDDTERTQALKEYHILDTETEQSYDDITRLAAYICEVPIAMISLVDEVRQWFKSKVGIEQQQTPREVAFCAHAILENRPFIIRDATKDKRFADNALVTGEPGIRFYAGIPLVNPQGMALGTLCVIDHQPRQLSAKQLEALEALSRQVLALLEFRRISTHLGEALDHVKRLQALLPICAWCKRVRDDKGYWEGVETYFHDHTGMDFTHGICPECLKKVRRNLRRKRKNLPPASPESGSAE